MSTDTNTAEQNTQTVTNSGNENTSTPTDGTVSMTQAELDAIISKRVGKAKENATNELLGNLGVKSADTLKELLEQKRLQDEQSKTDLEKLQEQLKSLEDEKNNLAQSLNQTKKQAEIKDLALKYGVKESDYFEMALDKAKSKDDFNEDQFIQQLKESKPFVFGGGVKTDNSSNGGGDTPKPLAEQLKGKSFAELQKLQASL